MWETISSLATSVFAASEGGGSGAQPTGFDPFSQMLPMFLLIGLAFWFIVYRPQKKEQTKRKSLLDNVKKGDKIVTIGGIHGWIADSDKSGQTVSLRVDSKTTMKINRSAISRVVGGDEDDEKESSGNEKNGKK